MKRTISKVLIANRGEIAVRVIRACREMGIHTVAVFSDADTESLHVKLADQAVRIGPGPARESYLRMDRIVEAAKRTGAQAVHPGYGLLSENPDFAQLLKDEGIILIGPSPLAMREMGNKTAAREKMRTAKVPIVPGSDGPVANLEDAKRVAEKIGFPVLLKAVSGGGGRGMRIVEKSEALAEAYDSAAREALGAFGDGRVYLERYLANPRHVEIQVMADSHGQCVYLGERECSVQRRHQKIIEETPCTVLTPELRQKMGECAVQAARSVNYEGAGTVEFLLDQGNNFYFIEMNTRLQVEHPITEMIFGVDLVRTQILVARGEKLPWKQSDLVATGAAIECRICAEDPDKNYQPSPGQITGVRFPGGFGVRVDSYIYRGYEIPLFYDPMIAKLVTWAETREMAIRRMISALKELQVQGVKTNVNLLLNILDHPQFVKGEYHINFLKEHPCLHPHTTQEPQAAVSLEQAAAMAAAIAEFQKRRLGVGQEKKSFRKPVSQEWKHAFGLRR